MHDELSSQALRPPAKEMTFIRELLVSNLWRSPEARPRDSRPEPAEPLKAASKAE